MNLEALVSFGSHHHMVARNAFARERLLGKMILRVVLLTIMESALCYFMSCYTWMRVHHHPTFSSGRKDGMLSSLLGDKSEKNPLDLREREDEGGNKCFWLKQNKDLPKCMWRKVEIVINLSTFVLEIRQRTPSQDGRLDVGFFWYFCSCLMSFPWEFLLPKV